MKLNIIDSFYTNAEDDKSKPEDDIVTEFELIIYRKHSNFYMNEHNVRKDLQNNLVNARIKIDLFVSLILPSGFEYNYNFKMIVELDTIYATIYFYNHATESGLYTVKIWGEISHLEVYAFDQHIFDPPGETEGTEPPQICLFY